MSVNVMNGLHEKCQSVNQASFLECEPAEVFLRGCHTCWVGCGGGGGVNNNLSIFSAVHEISRTFEMLPPPPPFPWEPPPPEWGGSTIFFIGFWTVHDISRTFYF